VMSFVRERWISPQTLRAHTRVASPPGPLSIRWRGGTGGEGEAYFRVRRRFRSALLLLLMALGASIGRAWGEDWPQFLGPRAHGISGETNLLDRWPASGPAMVWDLKTGTGYSGPSVRGNLLVLHHRIGDEEIIECFAADTGKPIWRHAYPSHFIDPYGYNNGP